MLSLSTRSAVPSVDAASNKFSVSSASTPLSELSAPFSISLRKTTTSRSSFTSTCTCSPSTKGCRRRELASSSSNSCTTALRSGLAPNTESKPRSIILALKASLKVNSTPFSLMRSTVFEISRSAMDVICSLLNALNRMISSNRFKNSGVKDLFNSLAFDVKMIRACLKDTVRPVASVRQPSSIICNIRLSTSGCAFSTSSNNKSV
mmetsp:Transcript_5655/g.9192  ORF Transcript_5655/g.9192 Transcript_5655/m.9192 type:complete len:206 (+) Transcript_5655:358-975(+)